MNLIKAIFSLSDKSFKIKFFLISILSCVVGILEVFSIGTLFILISDEKAAVDHFYILFEFFGVSESFQSKITVFSLAILFSTILRFILNSSSYLLTNTYSAYVSSQIFKTLISKVLIEDKAQRKDEFFASIIGKVAIVSNSCILSLIHITSNSIILIMIICFSILQIDFSEMLIFVYFLIFLSLLNLSTKKIVQRNSVKISDSYNALSTSLRETNNALIELYLYRKLTEAYLNFKNLQINMRRAKSGNQIISSLPKLTTEATLALLILYFSISYMGDLSKQDVNDLLKNASILIFLLVRTLPLLQILQQSTVSLNGNKKLVFDIQKLVVNSSLGEIILDNENLNFCTKKQNSITVKNLSFRIQRKKIFSNLNFTIGNKNFLLLSGQSGSGKSTILKILLGIEPHYKGEIH